MAVSDNQKLDYLWKKVGFNATKTDTATNKLAFNEAIPSPTLIRGDTIWAQSNLIPYPPPGATSGVVTVYQSTGRIQCTVDNSTVTPKASWKTNLTDWIDPQFGSLYLVKVYRALPGTSDPAASGGIQIFQGTTDDWFFDYQSGVLNFIGGNVPLVGSEVIFIYGYRYTGEKGSTDWESTYTTVYANSASWETGGSGSANLSEIAAVSGNWNSTYTSVCATSANWDEVYTAVTTYSASWNEGGTGASVDLSALAAASGNWNSTYTSLCTVSALYDSTYTSLCTVSANWDEVYTAVTTYSASWNEGGTGASVDLSALAAASGNWNSTYTSLCTVSANYDSVYSTVQANSASWEESAEIEADLANIASVSGNWNSTYTSLCTVSANYDSVYSSVKTSSANWNTAYNSITNDINPVSSYWARTDQNTLFMQNLSVGGSLTVTGSATFTNTLFTTTTAISVVNTGPGPALYIYQASGPYDIASFYDGDGVEVLHVGNAQGGGDPRGKIGINVSDPTVELTVNGQISANDIITVSGGNSNLWNSTYTSLCTVSALYDSVYSTVKANSASWEESAEIEADIANIASVSSNWNSTYTSLCTVSANYDSVYSSVQTNSASWNYGGSVDLSSIAAVSSNWNSTYTSLCTVSANYDSVYITVSTLSASWDDLSDLSALASASGNWNSTYTSLCTVSALYDSVYSTVKANSASWEESAEIEADLANIAAVSSNWNSTYTSLCTVSADYDSVYSTVKANSASWEESAEIEADLANIASVSSNWNSTYTSLCTVSANYNSVYSTVQTNSANYILDGGNTKNANIVIGTNDSYSFSIKANNNNYVTIEQVGNEGCFATSSKANQIGGGTATPAQQGGTGSPYGYAITLGAGTANGYNSIAFANGSATGSGSVAGKSGQASGIGSLAIGAQSNTIASGNYSFAIGSGVVARGANSIALGTYAETPYAQSFAWGSIPVNEYALIPAVSSTRTGQFMVSAVGGVFFPGNVGIGTDNKDNALTVAGLISTDSYNTSIEWNSTYTSLCTVSALYDSTYTSLCTVSADYDSVYSTVKANSASWEESAEIEADIANIASVSSNWNSTYTSLCTVSANYDSVYSSVQTNSASWNYGGSVDLSALAAASGNWNSTYTSLCTVSANYDSVYITVSTLSASWEESADIVPTVTNYLSTSNVQMLSSTIVDSLSVGGTLYTSTTAESVLKYSSNVGNGIGTSFNIIHNFNTKDIVVSVYDNNTNIQAYPIVTIMDYDTINLQFSFVPANNAYRVIVIGTKPSNQIAAFGNTISTIYAIEKFQFRTTDFNIISGFYAVDTTSGLVRGTLPSTPSLGDTFSFIDTYETWNTYNFVLQRNGNNIESLSQDLSANISGFAFRLTWVGGPTGWRIY